MRWRSSPVVRHRLSVTPPCLSLQFAEHSLRVHEMVVENAAGDGQQLTNGRISKGVPHGDTLFVRPDDSQLPQNRKLLRDDGLIQVQRVLQLLDGAVAPREDFENADPSGVSQRPEELCLERLERAGCHLCR